MKSLRRFLPFALAVVSICSFGQNSLAQGRDFWFGIPQNYDRSLPGAVYSFYLFISSIQNTTVFIQVGKQTPIVKTITAGQTLTLSSERGDIPKAQVESSGLIESEKAFHVWSDSADISVEFLSRAPYTTDGMFCVPTTGFGMEYSVGSYNAYPSSAANLPSEFMIVASEDGTVVEITPTCDIHKDNFPALTEHFKGVPFSISLNKGELIQFQTTTPATDTSDLTGTHILSNKPIGVIGASVCPNIPMADPSCDHLLEMLQPVRCWGNKYLTAPFAGRKFGGDAFLVIGTKRNQSIRQNDTVITTFPKAHDFQFIYDISNPSIWTSDTTFMLMQYVCSSTHGAPSSSNRNTGDPSMVLMNATAQFTDSILFEIPKNLAPSQPNFTHYINILVPVSHEDATTIDGHPLTSPGTGLKFGGTAGAQAIPGRRPIPGTDWEIILLQTSSVAGEGTHLIVSDTVIGAYFYGYSTDDSYAMSAQLGTKTIILPPLSVSDRASVTSDFSFLPLSPNPVANSKAVTFRYTLKKSARFKLELLDELGRTVGILLRVSSHPEGSFIQQLELPVGLVSGAYYCRYSVNNVHYTEKIIVR